MPDAASRMDDRAVDAGQDDAVLGSRAHASAEPHWWRPPVEEPQAGSDDAPPRPLDVALPPEPPPPAPAEPGFDTAALVTSPDVAQDSSPAARLAGWLRAVGLSRVLVSMGIAVIGAAWLWAGGSSSVFGSEQDAVDCIAALALLAGGIGAVVFAVRGVLAGPRED